MSRPSTFSLSSLRAALPRAGPSRLPARPQARLASTDTTSASHALNPYPFSSTAYIPPQTPISAAITPLPRSLLSPRSGTSVINHVNSTLRGVYDPSSHLTNLFSRRHPDRVKPGSIVTVISYTSPSKTTTVAFSGILMGIRRRGVDTSFTLRNIVNKIGVESSFKIYSPMVKEVKIVRRAERGVAGTKAAGGLRDLRRAKVNYLRYKPGVMERIAAALKAGHPQAGARPTQTKGKRV